MEIFDSFPYDHPLPPSFALKQMGLYQDCEELEEVLQYLRIWKKQQKKLLVPSLREVDEELIEGIFLHNPNYKFISLKLTFEVIDER